MSGRTELYDAETTMIVVSSGSCVKAFASFCLFLQDGKGQSIEQLGAQHVFCVHRKANKTEIARHEKNCIDTLVIHQLMNTVLVCFSSGTKIRLVFHARSVLSYWMQGLVIGAWGPVVKKSQIRSWTEHSWLSFLAFPSCYCDRRDTLRLHVLRV